MRAWIWQFMTFPAVVYLPIDDFASAWAATSLRPQETYGPVFYKRIPRTPLSHAEQKVCFQVSLT